MEQKLYCTKANILTLQWWFFDRFLETPEDDDGYIPTYDEIVHDSDDNLSEDEKTIEKQEEFEHKFNFRFEEPDKEFVSTFLFILNCA